MRLQAHPVRSKPALVLRTDTANVYGRELPRTLFSRLIGEPVLQAVFTDGLTHVSVFVEPYRPQRHSAEMQARQGATTVVMARRGEHWITAVGNVPPATLTQFAAAFERLRP